MSESETIVSEIEMLYRDDAGIKLLSLWRKG